MPRTVAALAKEQPPGPAQAVVVLVDDDVTENDDEDEDEDNGSDKNKGGGALAKEIGNSSSNAKRKRAKRRKQQAGRSKRAKKATISLADRLKEFPGSGLQIDHGHLMCCGREIGNDSFLLQQHFDSAKHKLRLEEKSKPQPTLTKFFEEKDEASGKGTILTAAHRSYRMQVMMMWMQAGLPLSRIGVVQQVAAMPITYSLSDHSNMAREHIPNVQQLLRKRVAAEIKGRDVSVCFDGSPFFGEAFALIVRFQDAHGDMQERLLRLRMLDRTMSGQDIAAVVRDILTKDFAIQPTNVLFFDRDGASANTRAMEFLKFAFSVSHDIVCISHTINNAGKRQTLEYASRFMALWNKIFAHSVNAKTAFKILVGKSQPTPSETRWWSFYEQCAFVSQHWAAVKPFLESDETHTEEARQNLLEFLKTGLNELRVRMELAALVDFGHELVKCTYILEGSRPLAVFLKEFIGEVTRHCAHITWIEVHALAATLPASDQVTAIVEAAKAGIQPVLAHFRARFVGDGCKYASTLALFDAAALALPSEYILCYGDGSPAQLESMKQKLARFQFHTSADINDLLHEAGRYFAAAQAAPIAGQRPEEIVDNLVLWWQHNKTLTAWARFARRMFLMQPSSASVERVFSVLTSTFGDNQANCLNDYVETTLMLRCNINENQSIPDLMRELENI